MSDRFKFRIWDKKLNKLAEWGENPYHNMEIMNYICVDNPVTDWKHEDYILMQCTGLKDKNGKLIYEGDICEYEFEDIGKQKAIIYFNNKYASFLKKPLNDFQYAEINDCKVIGNIYENKELLEEECQK